MGAGTILAIYVATGFCFAIFTWWVTAKQMRADTFLTITVAWLIIVPGALRIALQERRERIEQIHPAFKKRLDDLEKEQESEKH